MRHRWQRTAHGENLGAVEDMKILLLEISDIQHLAA